MTLLKTTTFGLRNRYSLVIIAILFSLAFMLIAKTATACDPIKDMSKNMNGTIATLGFADRLFEDRDYYRAITEYKRFIFLQPDSPLALNAQYKIGLSFFKGQKYSDAAKVLNSVSINPKKSQLTMKSLLKLGETHFKDAMRTKRAYERDLLFTESVDAYRRFIDEYPRETQQVDSARFKLAWTYLQMGWDQDAKDTFAAVTPDSQQHYYAATNISSKLDHLDDLPYKSPNVAGALSAILPGAGQVYCGYYKDATMSFILNGLFIWGKVELF